jgi:hypothetical protein
MAVAQMKEGSGMLDNPILIALMNNYNQWYSARFEQALAPYDVDNLESSGSIQIDSVPWFDEHVKIYESQGQVVLFEGLPLDFLGEHPAPDREIELAWYAAALSDGELPALIGDRVTANPQILGELVNELLQADWSQIREEEEDPASLALSRLIETSGPHLTTEQLEMLLDRYMITKNPDDLVTAALKTALTAQGDYTTGQLTIRLKQALDAGQPVEGPVEYLMIFLGSTGQQQHSAESFDAMRTAFRRATNKQVAAICLGDFGDPRGIAVMRSWLDSHPETDRATRLEIVAAIKRLGGEVEK